MDDIYGRLHADHQELLSLFEQIIERGQKDDTSFSRAKDLFTAHKDAEEDTFYDLLEQDEQLRPMIMQARMEHHAANTLFRETDWLTFNDEKWMAKVKVLHEMISHHVEKEEGELFEMSRSVIAESQAVELGERFERKAA